MLILLWLGLTIHLVSCLLDILSLGHHLLLNGLIGMMSIIYVHSYYDILFPQICGAFPWWCHCSFLPGFCRDGSWIIKAWRILFILWISHVHESTKGKENVESGNISHCRLSLKYFELFGILNFKLLLGAFRKDSIGDRCTWCIAKGRVKFSLLGWWRPFPPSRAFCKGRAFTKCW